MFGLKESALFVGVVENIDDPLKANRVQVRCYPYYTDDIPVEDLPWAQVGGNTTTGGSKESSESHGLSEGNWVFGWFLDGTDAQHPLIMCTLPGYADDSPDVSPLTRGQDDTSRPQPSHFTMPNGYGAKYPHNTVRQTKGGHIEEYDNTPGSERTRFYHKSGTQHETISDGSDLQTIVGDKYTLVAGDDYVEIQGSVNVFVDGSVNLQVPAGNVDATIGGTLTATSSTATINASQVDINAPLTMINGALQVAGVVTSGGGIVASAGGITAGGSQMTDSGDIISGRDVLTNSGISLDDHRHFYTWSGSGGTAETEEPTG